MYFAHFYYLVSRLKFLVKEVLRAYGEDTNTLETPDVLVEILRIGSDFMPCCNRCLQYILCRTVLEVCAVGNIDWSTVPVKRLINFRVFEVVVLKLYWSVNALNDSMIDRSIPSSSKAEGPWLSTPWYPSRQSHTLVHACTS
jgi:hypothetical protein